jgi:hypothetical protein
MTPTRRPEVWRKPALGPRLEVSSWLPVSVTEASLSVLMECTSGRPSCSAGNRSSARRSIGTMKHHAERRDIPLFPLRRRRQCSQEVHQAGNPATQSGRTDNQTWRLLFCFSALTCGLAADTTHSADRGGVYAGESCRFTQTRPILNGTSSLHQLRAKNWRKLPPWQPGQPVIFCAG